MLEKLFSFKTTPHGVVLTLLGQEYVPIESAENLIDQIKILEAALQKRAMTIKIMDERLKKDKELIEYMHRVMEAQNNQMNEQQVLIDSQRSKLKHIDRISWQMNKLKHEQKKIINNVGM